MDTHIRVSLNQDYRFSVEILNFHGPGVHLEVLLDTADLFQWQDALNEAWEEYAGVSVDGDYFALGGLSMGDMVRINREFARVIREAKHARVV